MGNLCSSGTEPGNAKAPPRRQPTFSAAHNRLRRDARVRDVYKLGHTIGSGAFSVVKSVTDRETGEVWACKVMTLPGKGQRVGDGQSTREDVFKEIDLMMSLRHPNIIHMKEYYEEEGKAYIIMDLLQGGELLEALLKKGPGEDGTEAHYSESDARVIFTQIMQGIGYMHEKGIVHRDLKLENLLLSQPANIATIKIADFGLAKKYCQANLSTICGTPQYVAPEVIRGGKEPYTYGKECDLWSAGVILFILLGGYPPFYDDSEPRLFRKIREGKYDMNDPVWDHVSQEAKDLLASLLVVDPAKRLTVEQVLAHPWMSQPERSTHRRDLLQTMSKMRTSMRNINLAQPPPENLGQGPGDDP